MINKVTMAKVASYKEQTELITDKPINLIYGLNGTGKSTFSNYLYDTDNDLYKYCNIESNGDFKILVYNQQFINDNFYEDSFKGIFTLSKENKEAKEKINELTIKINGLRKVREEGFLNINKIKSDIENLDTNYQNLIWNIKKSYDNKNYLDYCFEKIKKDKKTFFDFFININDNGTDEKDVTIVEKNIKELNTNNDLFQNIPEFINSVDNIESDPLFKNAVVGSKDSYLAELIEKLSSSDWVKKGIGYIDLSKKEVQKCPFCQKETIDTELVEELKKLFDTTYEQSLSKIEFYYNRYESFYNEIPVINLDNLPIDNSVVVDLSNKINSYKSLIVNNMSKIKEKKNMPSMIINLESSKEIVEIINQEIKSINIKINEINQKLINKKETLQKYKADFWTILKRNNNSTISSYLSEQEKLKELLKNQIEVVTNTDNEIQLCQNLITEQQKRTINIDESISNINNMLIEIGITDFHITKSSEKMYKIVRDDEDNNIFKTLSEGEKMIISFLYFVELCKGTNNPDSSVLDKVIVIDDPINSMSHLYVFNVGRLIKKMFFDNYMQVFILTHSLYFFYELAYIKKEDRELNQKLFRITKKNKESKFEDMHYSEIQNDYQAYWSVIKDKSSNPALIANCMRNIVEYFFGFIEKNSLNNVFQKPEFQDNKFQAFNRYINRESHSFGENIFDIKECDYDVFFEGFKLIFELSGYDKHYKSMMK